MPILTLSPHIQSFQQPSRAHVPGAQLSTRAPSALPFLQSLLKLLIGRSGTLFWIQPSKRCLGVFDSAWMKKKQNSQPQRWLFVEELFSVYLSGFITKCLFLSGKQKKLHEINWSYSKLCGTLPLHPRPPRLAWRWSSAGSESIPDPGSASGSHPQWL